MHAAGGVLDKQQDIQPLAQQRIDAEQVGGENALCLGGQDLSPGGAIAGGAGSMPARLRIEHTALAAIG